MLQELPPSLGAPGHHSYLGPATILSVEGRTVRLECPDEFPIATLALAHFYQPMPGDVVLAVGQAGAWYVIGVIEGRGSCAFTAPGDIEIHAPRGRIDILSRDGIRLRSRALELVADTLEVTARHALERFHDAARWVKNALHLRAGRVHNNVEEEYRLQAGEIVAEAEGEVRIDGETIHLS